MELGNILAQLRKEKGLSQRELATSLGVSNGAVAMWETNRRQPDIEMLIRIAQFYNVSIDYLSGNIQVLSTTKMQNLSSTEIKLIKYYQSVLNLNEPDTKTKNKITEFFPFASILSREEQELLEYYNELSLRDKRWIMGQIIDLQKKSEESPTQFKVTGK